MQNSRGVPKPGDTILTKAATLELWFLADVSVVQGDFIVTGSGMGTRSFEVAHYGKSWKWPPCQPDENRNTMRDRFKNQSRCFPTLEPRPGEVYVHAEDAIAFAESEVALSRLKDELGPRQKDRRAKMLRTTKDGRVVIDDLCACGELRSLHADLHDQGLEIGHGYCEVPGSTCQQYTWVSRVFAP